MPNQENFDNMPITKVVKAWMDSEEWKDEINLSDDRKTASIATDLNINNQSHRTFFETDEGSETFSVYMYSPISVPPARMADTVRILNHINLQLRLGRLACRDDTDANPVQFLTRIDVEGGDLALTQIGTMLGAAVGTMRRYGQLLAATALTKQSVAALWASYLEEEAAEEAVSKKAEEDSRRLC